jgi:hypothetical protein
LNRAGNLFSSYACNNDFILGTSGCIQWDLYKKLAFQKEEISRGLDRNKEKNYER